MKSNYFGQKLTRIVGQESAVLDTLMFIRDFHPASMHPSTCPHYYIFSNGIEIGSMP